MTVPVSPGDVIDGTYVIERLLGRGGMGAVFIAREERLARRVAIKVLLPAVANNPEAVVRFEREARSAAALQSDHVTRVLSVGHLPDGAPYIVMELLEGEDLAAILASRGTLAVHEVVGFMTQVCDALSEAHALGIVHRDLKPANVFLSRRPTGGTRVKVLDFGISKGATGTASPSLTATTALMGTPLYMSPEQLREARNVDGRADIWALGAMMYELLTGAPPFVADALAELCVLIMTTPHVPLLSRRPDVTPALDAIVNRCLQKDPADRFATVDDLRAALATVPLLGSPPAPAPTPPPPPRMATPRMNPAAALPPEAVHARPPPQAPSEPQRQLSPAPAQASPSPAPAATVDPVSTTQPGPPPKRPSALGVLLAFTAALSIGGVTLYVLVLRPTDSQPSEPAAEGRSSADGARGVAPSATASASSDLAMSDSSTRAAIASSSASSASAPRAAPPPAFQAVSPKSSPPAVVILPPPVTLPPPAIPSPPAVVAPPAVVVTPAPTIRVAPSAKPTATPPSNPGSLMPGARN